MTNYSDVRIFLCMTPTDMHYSFDRLTVLSSTALASRLPPALAYTYVCQN